jgi:SHS2 domain-containing protein
MSYALRDHTADVAVEATGADLGETFAAVAEGLTAAMCDAVPEDGERFSFTVRAESREALLFDYLDHLIYERDVRGVLPAAHAATVREVPAAGGDGAGSEWEVDASARGVALSAVDARDVKAVTYSEMELHREGGGWHAYVVFDV